MDVSDLTQMMPKRFTYTTILGSGNSAIAPQGPGAMFGRSTRNFAVRKISGPFKVSNTKYRIQSIRYRGMLMSVSLQSIEYKQMSERTMNGRLRKRPIEKYEICDNSLKTLTFPKWRSDGGTHCLRDSDGLTQPPGSRVEKRS